MSGFLVRPLRLGGRVPLVVLAAWSLAAGATAQPAGTAFTYQGRLTDNGTPPTGSFDFQCSLHTAAVGGAPVGSTVVLNDVGVANGLFTVSLDFGAGAFAGGARFLEIGVRPGSSTGAYTVLGARQEVKPAPHAVFSQTSAWAGIAGKPAGFADDVDNDSGGDITSVATSTGLTGGGISGGVILGLDFPAVAAGHNHFGQTWNGSQPLGLTVNNSAVGAAAIQGSVTAPSGAGAGLLGLSAANGGAGVEGAASSATGTTAGVRGIATSTSGRGVHGLAAATTGTTAGVYGEATSTAGRGVFGLAASTSGVTTGVYGQTQSTFFASGVHGLASSSVGSSTGVRGETWSQLGGVGVWGRVLNVSSAGSGVRGDSASPDAPGVEAVAANNGVALYADAFGTAGRAVLAFATQQPTAFAGYFGGNVNVTGTLSKSAGSFRIDHPLDPENRYLYHSFVESPDMKNVYDGTVVTDGDGFATVELPEWFEALNRDFRYQLTVLDEGDTAGFVQAKVVSKVAGNRFTLRTSAPRVEVSWQVTGIRQDAYAQKHRIPVEQWKPEHERGRYLHPADWDLPPERAVDWPRRRP